MAINISKRSLYKASIDISLNTNNPRPTLANIGVTTYDPTTVYLVHSTVVDRFALIFALPVSITAGGTTTPESLFWLPLSVASGTTIAPGEDNDFASILDKAGYENRLYLVWETDGDNYKPDENTSFLSTAVAGRLYIHVYKYDATTYYAYVTNNLGKGWSDYAYDFVVGGAFIGGIVHTSEPYIANVGTHLPAAVPADGTSWFPPTQVQSPSTIGHSYDCSILTVTSLADIAANALYPTVTTAAVGLRPSTVYYVTSTHQLVFALPTLPGNVFDKTFLYDDFLPVTGMDSLLYPLLTYNTVLVNNGVQPSLCVRIDVTSLADIAWADTLPTFGSGVRVIVSANKLQVASLMSSSMTTIVIDAVPNNVVPTHTRDENGNDLIEIGLPIYIFPVGWSDPPIINDSGTVLPATYVNYGNLIPGATTTKIWTSYYAGGKSVRAIANGNHLEHYLAGTREWNVLAHHFTTGGVSGTTTDFRISCKPASVLSAAVLNVTPTANIAIGMHASDAPHFSLAKTTANSHVINTRDPHTYWFVYLNPLDATVTVVSHRNTSGSFPPLATEVTLANNSGVTLDWVGGTLLELGVTKLSNYSATLSIYLNGQLVNTTSVPWIPNGIGVSVSTSEGALSGSGPTFTLKEYMMTIGSSASIYVPPVGVVDPGVNPDPIINSGFVEVMPVPIIGQLTSNSANPYQVYIRKNGAVSTIYFPVLAGNDPYKPTRYAAITNYPFISGAEYNLFASLWNGGERSRSFVSDGHGVDSLPEVVHYGAFISSDPIVANTFQVTIRTGVDWVTTIGVFTATVVPDITTYLTNPYPLNGIELFGPLLDSTRLRSNNTVLDGETGVVLHSSSASQNDALISVPFAVADADAESWTLSFKRRTAGAYSTDAAFGILIRSLRHDYLDYDTPSDQTIPLDVLPLPQLSTIRIKMGNNSNDPIVVQVSAPQGYAYLTPAIGFSSGQFRPFDATQVISVQTTSVGEHTVLELYADQQLVYRVTLSIPWMSSGSIVFYHVNSNETSNEHLTDIGFRQGKVTDIVGDKTPLLLAPTINDSSSMVVDAAVLTKVHTVGVDKLHGYADLYIRNAGSITVTIKVLIVNSAGNSYTVATALPVASGGTQVLRSRLLQMGDSVYVQATGSVIVRVATTSQLR